MFSIKCFTSSSKSLNVCRIISPPLKQRKSDALVVYLQFNILHLFSSFHHQRANISLQIRLPVSVLKIFWYAFNAASFDKLSSKRFTRKSASTRIW